MRALLVVVALSSAALAQNKPSKDLPPRPDPPVIDIGPLDLVGKIRGVMLLEFLERVAEEVLKAG